MQSANKSSLGLGNESNFCRISYLAQASRSIISTSSQLSQYYGKVMRTISEKTPAKIDFSLKRFTCKKCSAALVPGINTSYRLKSTRKKGKKYKKLFPTQIISCLCCKTVKKFPTNPSFKVKADANGKIMRR